MDLSGYRFSNTHEWVNGSSGRARVGITEYAQSQLGDVIFVELPAEGSEVAAGGKFGVIESVKAASDLYSPTAGRVASTNQALAQSPELINSDPYGEGWMLEVELSGEISAELLDEAAYQEYVQGL
jgi:glycine cleavage system H protein